MSFDEASLPSGGSQTSPSQPGSGNLPTLQAEPGSTPLEGLALDRAVSVALGVRLWPVPGCRCHVCKEIHARHETLAFSVMRETVAAPLSGGVYPS